MSETREVVLTPEALGDLDRLDMFLRPLNPEAADRFHEVFHEAVVGLIDNPWMGRPWTYASEAHDIRELFISFGKSGYVARYEVQHHFIVIARVHHFLEDRQAEANG